MAPASLAIRYLGFPSSLGSPAPCAGGCIHAYDGVAALLCYCRYLADRLHRDRHFRAQVQALETVPAIACVWAPAPCHGDALAAYVYSYSERAGIICGTGTRGRTEIVNDQCGRQQLVIRD